MSDLCPRRYFGVCRGGVSVSDLCRRNYIGDIAVISAFAEEVSSGAVPKSCQVDPSSPQLCWRLQRRCQCE